MVNTWGLSLNPHLLCVARALPVSSYTQFAKRDASGVLGAVLRGSSGPGSSMAPFVHLWRAGCWTVKSSRNMCEVWIVNLSLVHLATTVPEPPPSHMREDRAGTTVCPLHLLGHR